MQMMKELVTSEGITFELSPISCGSPVVLLSLVLEKCPLSQSFFTNLFPVNTRFLPVLLFLAVCLYSVPPILVNKYLRDSV